MRDWYEDLLEMQAENAAYNREMAEFFHTDGLGTVFDHLH